MYLSLNKIRIIYVYFIIHLLDYYTNPTFTPINMSKYNVATIYYTYFQNFWDNNKTKNVWMCSVKIWYVVFAVLNLE